MSRTVSFTEIATWKTCRRKWHWRYELDLEPLRYASHIILGTLCHKAFELANTACEYEDIRDALRTTVTESLPEGYFEEELEEGMRQADMGISVMERFSYHMPLDNALGGPYYTMAVELDFDLRIPGRREHLVGRIDHILRDIQGRPWLVEYKFPRTFRSEEDVQLSTQIATYQWAAKRIGYPCVGVLYVQVLPRLPEIPAQNKDGSTSRREIYTDWQTYARTITERGDDPERYRDEMVPKLADKEFWRVYKIYRTPQQVEEYIHDLKAVTADIAAKNKRIYFCENSIHCGGCMYRNLCLEVARGIDPTNMINSAYQKRTANAPDTATTNGVET